MSTRQTDRTTNLVGLLDESEEATPWLVEGLIVEHELVMVHGPAHVGKTYMVLDLALRLATGLPDFHGFPIAGQRPVLYVPSEGRRGVSRRIGSWLKVHRPEILAAHDEDFLPAAHEVWGSDDEGVPQRVTQWDPPRYAVPFERYEAPGDRSAPMLTLAPNSPESVLSVGILRRTLERLGKQQGTSPVLVVDVVGDFATPEENSRDFGHALGLLHPENLGDATVVLVHHEGWGGNGGGAKGRPRGHSSVDGLVDARIGLDAITNGTEDRAATLTNIKVSNPKQRSDDRQPPFILTLTKPTPELVNPVITGRPVPLAERMLLNSWGKSNTAKNAERSETRSDSNRTLTLAEVETVRAVRAISERNPETPVVTLAELVEETGVAKTTALGRRNTLLDKGFLAPDSSRGQGGFALTALGTEVSDDK